MSKLLELRKVRVEVDGKEILGDINLSLDEGETMAVFGPNGAGKTSLIMAIMGMPRYRVIQGRILFKGKDVTDTPMEERARMGIGLSFQRPPVVRGVRLRDILLASLRQRGDERFIESLAEKARMNDFLDREVNYGFSGGEIKRAELLQLLAQNPDLALLDEPESGVDLVNIALIGEMINLVLQKEQRRQRHHAGLIITHTGHILDYVHVDKGCVLLNGTIWCQANPLEILDTIKKSGYEECVKCEKRERK